MLSCRAGIKFSKNRHQVLFSLFLCAFFLFDSASATARSKGPLDNLVFDVTLPGPVILDTSNNLEIFSTIASRTSTQQVSNTNSQDSIVAYQERINSIEIENGPFDASLPEELHGLAKILQERGDHEEAIELLEKAEYISRINFGLDSPEQFTSIEMIIDSHIATGDMIAANEKQQYLLFLINEFYGSGNMISLPHLVNLANRNMNAFNEILHSPPIPVISFSSGNNFFPSRSSTPPKMMAFGNLFRAHSQYYQAVTTLLDNKEYFNPLLLDLEYKLLETYFLQTYRSALIENPHYYLSYKRRVTGSLIGSYNHGSQGYHMGADALQRILIYTKNNPAQNMDEIILAMTTYGDWHLLFDRNKTANKQYRKTYEFMVNAGIAKTKIEKCFSPPVPVHLPLFTPRPNTREKFNIPKTQELEYDGYIDISFEISRYGSARKFKILEKSESTSRDIERRLKRMLRNSPFRPAIVNGTAEKREDVVLRYYYSLNPLESAATSDTLTDSLSSTDAHSTAS